jgi:hypothetical protein
MSTRDKIMQSVGLLVFMMGLVLGLFFFGLLTWAEIEVLRFDPYPGLPIHTRLKTLRCPAVVGAGEVGTVHATLTNPLDQSIDRTIYVYISEGSMLQVQEHREDITLEPGETRRLEWPVTAQDAAWDRFVLVRAFVVRRAPLPARTGSCGIIATDLLPLRGIYLAALAIGASLILMAGGTAMWARANRPLQDRSRSTVHVMMALSLIVLVGIGGGLLRWWMLAGLLFIVTILLIVTSIERAVNG